MAELRHFEDLGAPKPYRDQAFGITVEFSKGISFVKFDCNFEGRFRGKARPIPPIGLGASPETLSERSLRNYSLI